MLAEPRLPKTGGLQGLYAGKWTLRGACRFRVIEVFHCGAQDAGVPSPTNHTPIPSETPNWSSLTIDCAPLAMPQAKGIQTAPDVLIVEDQPHIARLLEYVMEGEGFTVDIAHDGALAEQKLMSVTYSAVLLDLDLPGRNGLELLQVIRSSTQQKRPSVIVLSAMCSERVAEKVIEAGADAHYPKPIVPAVLLMKMKELGVTNRRDQLRAETLKGRH